MRSPCIGLKTGDTCDSRQPGRATHRLIPGAKPRDTKAVRGRTPERPFSIGSRGLLSDSDTAMVDEDIENAIRQNAQGPASAEADGVKAAQHTLADQIAAARAVGQAAPGRRHQASVSHGLRVRRGEPLLLVPDGQKTPVRGQLPKAASPRAPSRGDHRIGALLR